MPAVPTPQQALEHLFQIGFCMRFERLPVAYELQRPEVTWDERYGWGLIYKIFLLYLMLHAAFFVQKDVLFVEDKTVYAPAGKDFRSLLRRMIECDPYVHVLISVDFVPADASQLICRRTSAIVEDDWGMANLRYEECLAADGTYDKRHAMAAALRELGCEV